MSPNTGKYGFVNDGGLVMIDPVYDQAYDFNNGMALVSKDDKYGYISENGNIVVQPKYEYASSFSCGYAVVKNQEKYKFSFVAANVCIGATSVQTESNNTPHNIPPITFLIHCFFIAGLLLKYR